ncbi:hypothetical protein Droror1_Dr00000127, partial [Drosera rotundifolia]
MQPPTPHINHHNHHPLVVVNHRAPPPETPVSLGPAIPRLKRLSSATHESEHDPEQPSRKTRL